jgi:hypothetical protein
VDGENARPPGEIDPGELEPRPPSEEDLVRLCKSLNQGGARYVVIGGFAIIVAGFPRTTGNIDLLVDTTPANETLVYRALEVLPDQAVRELAPGQPTKYSVVRVADEIVVDLMKSACGIEYPEAAKDLVVRELQGVSIPFASPRLLWRMKINTNREKDRPDLFFLRQLFAESGQPPPEP